MTDIPTPGQMAYAAYWRVDAWTFSDPWDHLTPTQQAAWDAAAQAVRADSTPGQDDYPATRGRICPACASTSVVSSWPAAGLAPQDLTRPVTCSTCGATWTAVYTLTGYAGLTRERD